MPIGTESLLIEAGIAGVFAVFVIIMTRETFKYMNKRDEIISLLSKNVADLTQNIAELTVVVEKLHRKIDQACPPVRPRAPTTRR
jgi:uncharacterized protein YoxC